MQRADEIGDDVAVAAQHAAGGRRLDEREQGFEGDALGQAVVSDDLGPEPLGERLQRLHAAHVRARQQHRRGPGVGQAVGQGMGLQPPVLRQRPIEVVAGPALAGAGLGVAEDDRRRPSP